MIRLKSISSCCNGYSRTSADKDSQTVKLLSESTVLVAGTVRDCEQTVRSGLIRISAALKDCGKLYWVVVESDSRDKTCDVLLSLAKENSSFRYISLGSLRHEIPTRTARIAHCRNTYLKELRSNPLYSKVDYIVVADLDGVNDLISAKGIASCWDRSDWHVCCANQRGPYYDIYALRHPDWNPNDGYHQCNFLVTHGVSRKAASDALYSRMITIAEGAEWIEVESAFGGLAIYRREALEDVNYCGTDSNGRDLCEHVSLNTQIRSKGYRIFINPCLINTAVTEHSLPAVNGNLSQKSYEVFLFKLRKIVLRFLSRVCY